MTLAELKEWVPPPECIEHWRLAGIKARARLDALPPIVHPLRPCQHCGKDLNKSAETIDDKVYPTY